MRHFEKNVSFFAIDLAQVILETPAVCGEMLQQVSGTSKTGR
jgi:hypothetical protein